MPTLFISDLHLCASRPAITQRFFEFLEENTTRNAEALFILGDFFEVWLGDDNVDPQNQRVIEALAKFTEKGPPVYFMRGNRDFLISKRFAKETGVKLIPDPYVVKLYGNRVLLMHGDSLCTLDIPHQRFRKVVQNPIIQGLFLTLPLSWRRKIGKKLRKKSRETFNKRSLIPQESHRYEVVQAAVDAALIQHQAQVLIHGHTHQAGIHEFKLNNQPAKRIVLGEWGTLGNVLIYAGDSLELKNI